MTGENVNQDVTQQVITPGATSGQGGTENVLTETTSTEQTETVTPYTLDELNQIIEEGGEIDRKRLTPDQLAIQKTFERGYTPKFQEAAALKKQAEEILEQASRTPEVYFEDANKNGVFTDYLTNPVKVVSDINQEIARLEGVEPFNDDGTRNPSYAQARREIAYWNGIKDEFSLKRADVMEKRRADEALTNQLGEEGKVLEAYAKSLGFSAQDFRTKSELRKTIKGLYDLANAGQTAKKKEVKPNPPKLATQQGGGGGTQTGTKDPFDPNLSTEERIELWKAQRK